MSWTGDSRVPHPGHPLAGWVSIVAPGKTAPPALSQVTEALAADMIDLKRADRLLAVLRLASRNLMKADKWPASPYHTEVEASAINLVAEYGLPRDFDLAVPPEDASPPGRFHNHSRRVPHPCPPGRRAGWERNCG